MNHSKLSILIVLLFFISTAQAKLHDNKAVIYVSPSGSDRADGSINRPLQSLKAARDKVRLLKKKGTPDITVILREGTYPIENTLVFGPEDSGKEGHPIIWEAYNGEKPVLSGGVEITGGWQKADNGIWQAKLDRSGKLRQLIVNDKPAKMAQYKKKVTGQGGYGQIEVKGNEPWAFRQGKEIDGMLVNKSDIPAISHPEDLEVQTQTTWTMSRLCIRGMKDEGTRWALLLSQPYSVITQAIGPGTVFNPNVECRFFNAKEFLTDPGEFYFDKSTKILSYKPRDGEDMTTVKVIAPQTESLIQIQGTDLKNHASHLQFKGLTFAYTSWPLMGVDGSYGACSSQANCFTVKYGMLNWHDDLYQTTDLPSAAVVVNSASHIIFERNIFKHIGSMGINFENDVVSSRIEGNVFQFIGGTAINVGHPQHVFIGKQNGENEGFGPYHIDNSADKWTEDVEGLCTNVLIASNLIRETGIDHKPSVALMLYFGHGLSITHNDIAYAPYSGISLGWGWEEWDGITERSKGKPSMSLRNTSVTYNKIGHVLQTLHDGGGIYLLSRQSPFVKDSSKQQWTNICNNYLYDFGGVTRAGIHTDNGAQYFLCRNNVFNNLPWSLIKASEYARKGNIRIENNYANTALYFTEGDHQFAPNTTIEGNVDVENGNWPEEARNIMEEAGLEIKYRDMFQEIR